MTLEAYPEAAALLRDAGWKPHDGWGVYTRDTLVMGFQPDGQGFHVKNWAKISEGDPQYSTDTPDTAEEAAAWLVARYAPSNPLEGEATLEPPVYVTPVELVQVDRTRPEPEHGEVVSDRSEPERDDGPAVEAAEPTGGSGLQDELGGEEPGDGDAGVRGDDYTDADFTIEDLGGPDEPLSLEAPPPEDFAFEEIAAEADASGAFIFGDNLHQMRTAAIGLVVQAAIERLPDGIDYARLAELRNFVMGVSEGRWADDTAKRDELDQIEATERQRRAVEAARDEKVAFLIEASREQIEAFDPQADWPS